MIDKSLQELKEISYELESLRDIKTDDLDNLGEFQVLKSVLNVS